MNGGIREHITGSKSDRIMEEIECSGLIIRKYNPLLKKKKVRNIFDRFKKQLIE